LRPIALSLAILSIVNISQPQMSESESYFQDGINAYNSGNFTIALRYLSAATSSEFNNPLLHYYLANTLLELHRPDEAMRQYNMSYTLDPDSSVANYCKLAMSSYSSVTKVKDRVNSSPSALLQSVSQIHKQTESIKELSAQNSTQYADSTMGNANKQIDHTEHQTASDLGQVEENAAGNQDHRTANLSAREAQQISRDAANKIRALKRESQLEAKNSMEQGMKNSLNVEESASNLERLMTEPQRAGSVTVKKEGTNLYIRNYASQ
jgi:tetratricopeptide (TPR) repeat protein